jgi:hypothetical protein
MFPQVRTPDTEAGPDRSRPASNRRHVSLCNVQLYGWDGREAGWYGPNELNGSSCGIQRLLDTLRRAPGRSWYGPVNCSAAGEPASRFFALIHDLGDSLVAMIYCDESKTGPAEIVTVIPAERRGRLRDEFPFEFLAFTSFLGSTAASAGPEIHDRVTAAIAEAGPDDSLVFSISTGLWTSDLDHVLSRCVEKVALAMLRWASES